MQKTLPALAVIFLGLGWPVSAQAEEVAPYPTHPADTTATHQTDDGIDPFALSVPLLNRGFPAPSFVAAPSGSSPPSEEAEAVPSMDHSNMPGMDHSNMPDMSGN